MQVLQGLIEWFSYNIWVGVLLVLMLGDIGMGTLLAIRDKRVSSTIAKEGMITKAAMILFVAVFAVLEMILKKPLVSLIAGLFSAVEFWSLIENALRAGVPLPDAMIARLAEYFPKVAKANEEAREGKSGDVTHHS